jgi:hypothetical protein
MTFDRIQYAKLRTMQGIKFLRPENISLAILFSEIAGRIMADTLRKHQEVNLIGRVLMAIFTD